MAFQGQEGVDLVSVTFAGSSSLQKGILLFSKDCLPHGTVLGILDAVLSLTRERAWGGRRKEWHKGTPSYRCHRGQGRFSGI